jgi:hypothetical protein
VYQPKSQACQDQLRNNHSQSQSRSRTRMSSAACTQYQSISTNNQVGHDRQSNTWFGEIPFSLARSHSVINTLQHVAMCSSKCLTCKIERARVKVRRQSVHSTKHACRRECERNKRTHDVQCATQATGHRSDVSFLIKAGPFFQTSLFFVNQWTHFWHCAELTLLVGALASRWRDSCIRRHLPSFAMFSLHGARWHVALSMLCVERVCIFVFFSHNFFLCRSHQTTHTHFVSC